MLKSDLRFLQDRKKLMACLKDMKDKYNKFLANLLKWNLIYDGVYWWLFLLAYDGCQWFAAVHVLNSSEV